MQKYQNPSFLAVSFKKTKAGNTVALVKILTQNSIMWRSVSGRDKEDRQELFRQAIETGKKHCNDQVAYQLPLF